ncbi:MAG: hypothetical protein ACLPKI_30315 [Streptosporangiaceae bacterium]
MMGTKRFRMPGTRAAGLALAGLLAGGLALASTTAFASTSSPSAGMAGMTSSSHGRVGFTKGFYNGHTVRFYYTRNFSCQQPPASTASSKCEGGTNYTQTPASTFDPLYVIVPLGFTPPKNTLQCPTGRCIDHPHTIDLTSVLGSGTGDLPLPAHSHIVATANSGQSEWWNVDIVGVKSLPAWNKLVWAKSDRELQYLQRTDSAAVTGNIPTNLFLFFAVK